MTDMKTAIERAREAIIEAVDDGEPSHAVAQIALATLAAEMEKAGKKVLGPNTAVWQRYYGSEAISKHPRRDGSEAGECWKAMHAAATCALQAAVRPEPAP